MKILYIHQYFSTPDNGGGTRSYEFARRFVQAGHQVTVIAGGATADVDVLEIAGIKVVRLPVKYSNIMKRRERIISFLAFAWKAYVYGRKLEIPNVIYATSTPLTVGFPALMLSKRFRCRYVFEVRDLWPEAPVQMQALKNPLIIWLLRMFEKLVYKKAAHVIGLSPGMVAGILATGTAETKVSMIPNCSDLDVFQPNPDKRSLTSKYNLKDKAVILYAGALSDANGLDIILESAKEISQRKDIVIVIAGGGRRKDFLTNKAAELGLANVLFVGKVSKAEVAQLHGVASACLVLFKELPILSTNSPNKFFDALAAGKPVITNMDGWIHDLVTEHNAGVGIGAIPSGRAKRLADAIEFIADNSEVAREMGANARAMAEAQFDRDLLAVKVQGILERASNG